MERVRCVVCGLMLVLGLSFCPSIAYASDGFLGGLEDLVGVREIDNEGGYESEYLDSYESQVRANPEESGTSTLNDLGEDATTVDYVNGTLDYFNKVPVNSNKLSLMQYASWALGGYAGQNRVTMSFFVGIVFMWWGVRKCIRLVMSAFRKGSMKL